MGPELCSSEDEKSGVVVILKYNLMGCCRQLVSSRGLGRVRRETPAHKAPKVMKIIEASSSKLTTMVGSEQVSCLWLQKEP